MSASLLEERERVSLQKMSSERRPIAVRDSNAHESLSDWFIPAESHWLEAMKLYWIFSLVE